MNDKKIKVMQFVGGFNVGGAEAIVKQYCLLFNPQIIDLIVLCIHNFHSIYDEELKRHGIKVIYVDDFIDRKLISPYCVKRVFHRILRVFIIKKVINQWKPDIIHTHLEVNSYIRHASINYNPVLVHTAHSDPEFLWNQSRAGKRDRRALEWLARHYRIYMIALHDNMRIRINNMFHIDDTVVFNNGIDIQRFLDAGKKHILRKKYGVKEDVFVVGNVASLSPVKNHSFLMDVFNHILKKEPCSELWLVGTGKNEKALKEKAKKLKIADHVVFWGRRNDIPHILKMMDVVGFPSFYEGLSVSLVESQVAGIPAIVSDKVSAFTKISNYLTFCSLDQGAEYWADRMLEYKDADVEPGYVDIENWDIQSVVKKLESYYLDLV